MGLFWGRYQFFHWLLRGFTGNWVKTVPYYNSARPRPSPTQNLKMVVRIRPLKVYFCSFLNLSLSIGCYPDRKTMKIMINNVLLLFSATNEETQYPFPCIATRTLQGPVSRKSRGNYRAQNNVLFYHFIHSLLMTHFTSNYYYTLKIACVSCIFACSY